jgi:hypothetical protein
MSSETSSTQPSVQGTAEQQGQQPDAPEAKPRLKGTLEDLDTNELNKKRNQILWEQAVKGQQPGLTLIQDRLSGNNKQETWGNEPTIMEPEEQN